MTSTWQKRVKHKLLKASRRRAKIYCWYSKAFQKGLTSLALLLGKITPHLHFWLPRCHAVRSAGARPNTPRKELPFRLGCRHPTHSVFFSPPQPPPLNPFTLWHAQPVPTSAAGCQSNGMPKWPSEQIKVHPTASSSTVNYEWERLFKITILLGNPKREGIILFICSTITLHLFRVVCIDKSTAQRYEKPSQMLT